MNLTENAARRRCEEQRRYAAELERLATRLRDDALRLRGEVAAAAPDPALKQRLIERQAKVERSIAVIVTQIEAAKAALGAAEQELKRHELTFAWRERGAGIAGRPSRRRRGRPPSLPTRDLG